MLGKQDKDKNKYKDKCKSRMNDQMAKKGSVDKRQISR